MHLNVLRKWVRGVRDELQEAFPGNGNQKAHEAKIVRLSKEVTKLNLERVSPKKVAAYFAKESK